MSAVCLFTTARLECVISDYPASAIRGVVGLGIQFANAPFDLFLEIGPGVNVIPIPSRRRRWPWRPVLLLDYPTLALPKGEGRSARVQTQIHYTGIT